MLNENHEIHSSSLNFPTRFLGTFQNFWNWLYFIHNLFPKLKNLKIVQKSSEWLKSTRSHLDIAFSFKTHKKWENEGNGILLPNLFWPTVRKNCYSDRETFEIRGWRLRIWIFLRSLEQFIQTVKDENNFW